MKLILAPTDFSLASLNAVNYAADLASSIEGNLFVSYIYQPAVIVSEVTVLPVDTGEMIRQAEAKMERTKKHLVDRTHGRIKIHTEVKTGIVKSEIREYAEVLKPYAVVMATHGAGAVERFLMGSNTLSAMKHLPCPLIVVPENISFDSIRNIGLACDYKDVTDITPIKEIKDLVRQFNASLFVVYVNQSPSEEFARGVIREAEVLENMLEDLHPHYDYIGDSSINKALADYAAAKDLDLLILAPKKHSLLQKIFHPGHTKQMVLHAPIPLMTIHE